MNSFAEVTRTGHGHGGAGWGLGQCLWHQATTRSGQDRNANMRAVKPGDEVFHLVSGLDPKHPRRRFLWGASQAATPCRVVDEPPIPGDWPDRGEYYRIDLKACEKADPPIPLDDVVDRCRDLIFEEIGTKRLRYYLFSPRGEGFRITQGIYVTTLSKGLANAFRESLLR